MSQTPPEVQAEAKRRLLAAEGMTRTAEWVRSQGHNVSRSGLGRWWKGCASEDEAIERACREAKAWIGAHGEDAGLVMGSGNAMRVQQVLSDWIAAGRLDPEKMEPKDILSALSSLMNAQARVEAVRTELVETAWWKNLVYGLMSACAVGYAVAELRWEEGPSKLTRPVTPAMVPAAQMTWRNGRPQHIYEATGQALRDLYPGQYILHENEPGVTHPVAAGCLRAVALIQLYLRYAWVDWAGFNERFGKPWVIARHDPGLLASEKASLRRMLASLGQDITGTLSRNIELQIEKGWESSGQLFERMIAACNREISKAVLGQTLTTDTTGGTGTFAAASVHNEVRRDLQEADADGIATTLQRDLVAVFVGQNFPGAALPRLAAILPSALEASQGLAALAFFAKEKLPVAVRTVHDITGIEPPTEDDELVEWAAAPRPEALALSREAQALSRHGGVAGPPSGAHVCPYTFRPDGPPAPSPDTTRTAPVEKMSAAPQGRGGDHMCALSKEGEARADAADDVALKDAAAAGALRDAPGGAPQGRGRMEAAVEGADTYEGMVAAVMGAQSANEFEDVAAALTRTLLLGELAGRAAEHEDMEKDK